MLTGLLDPYLNDPTRPHQAELLRRLLSAERPVCGSIESAYPHAEHILDALAWSFGLLPEDAMLVLEPMDVVSLAWAMPECFDCARPAMFEVYGVAGWVAAFLCQPCAVARKGDAPLGTASAQLLIGEADIPEEVNKLLHQVALEVHGVANLI